MTFPVPKTVFEPGTSKIQSTKFSDCDGRYPVYGIRNCLRVVDFGDMFVIITCSWSLRARARVAIFSAHQSNYFTSVDGINVRF